VEPVLTDCARHIYINTKNLYYCLSPIKGFFLGLSGTLAFPDDLHSQFGPMRILWIDQGLGCSVVLYSWGVDVCDASLPPLKLKDWVLVFGCPSMASGTWSSEMLHGIG
jgi:hypothetical protein